EIGLVLPPDHLDMPDEIGSHDGGQHRHAVAVAGTLEQTQPCAVEQERHDPWHPVQSLEDGTGLVAGQDHGWVLRRLARTTSSSHGRSTSSTSRYRKSRALSAWFWVEAATLSRTAREVRNAVTSAGPMWAGCSLSWKKMNRRIQWT